MYLQDCDNVYDLVWTRGPQAGWPAHSPSVGFDPGR